MQEETVNLLAGQKRWEDDYNNPDVLSKFHKADMAGTMDAIKEYLRLHSGVVKAPPACIIRKTIVV